MEFNCWSWKGYCYTIVDSRHGDLLALKDKGAKLMLSPIVRCLGKLGFIGQSCRERGRLCIGLKQTHISTETVLDWRRYQSWGSWV